MDPLSIASLTAAIVDFIGTAQRLLAHGLGGFRNGNDFAKTLETLDIVNQIAPDAANGELSMIAAETRVLVRDLTVILRIRQISLLHESAWGRILYSIRYARLRKEKKVLMTGVLNLGARLRDVL
jgi:hypothetical protein